MRSILILFVLVLVLVLVNQNFIANEGRGRGRRRRRYLPRRSPKSEDDIGFHEVSYEVSEDRGQKTEDGRQMSEDREPQNIEFRMLNIEGKENFIIRNSLFDIRYSKHPKVE